MADLGRYRHKVFVEKLGWQLQCEHGLEYDQFDRDDTIYVLAKNDDDQIIGTARLLPTSKPYLLGEVFPQLLNGQLPPCSSDIWELSRFAAVDFDSSSTSALRQFSSEAAISLLRQSMETAMRVGARRVITVSPLGIERLLRRAGFEAARAGAPMKVDGMSIFANWINPSKNAWRSAEH
ncbi:acyl-homoserine-lactone synthase [Hydrogenophaga sp. RWCD_12]|uniref:acyl-homoserine-lactone synthase n=1 Tax=Hydrogenophaga sp. RWCD_12 TaxID=3391190 RepID=UPI00398501D9